MSGRIRDFNITFVDNQCFNTRCDVNDICKHYSETATADQRKRFIVIPCIQCNFFSDSRTIETSDEPDRPFLKAF